MTNKRGHPMVSDKPLIRATITLTEDDLTDLLAINPKLSKAIRQVMKERKERQHDNG